MYPSHIVNQHEILEEEEEEVVGPIHHPIDDEMSLIDDLFFAVMEFCDERSLPIAEYLDRSAIQDLLFRMSGKEF